MSEANLQTESLFSAALAIESPEERAKYLDQVCGSDQSLRARVEELLAAYPRVERFLEAPAAFIWHALNAYEEDGGIVADFVGYDAPDHFVPHDALFYRLMQGELGTAKAPGKLRRYRIDLRAKTLREEIVDGGSHEFPMIDPRAALPPNCARSVPAPCAPACCSVRSAPASTTTTWRRRMRWKSASFAR